MIRNLDYWQPASGAATNIVIVNNNNRGSVATAATTTGQTTANATAVDGGSSSSSSESATTTVKTVNGGGMAICNNNNNNNEEGFGDKNGTGLVIVEGEQQQQQRNMTKKIVKIVAKSPEKFLARPSPTVIVTMEEQGDEQIEVAGEETIIEGDVDDLIEENEDDSIVIEEEEEINDTKGLDTSLDEETVEVETVIVAGRKENVTRNKSNKSSSSRSTLTPNTSSTNSSFEESTMAAATATSSSANTTGTSPDHHARRPMNAFLIFCKKHRPIVREKYPNLENRAITKILGDWWANLEKKDQEPFKSLASNYKDAFLSANPNFKWYKLPAPPLRTLSTRPTNSERSYGDLLVNGLGAGQKSTFTSSTSKGSRGAAAATAEEYFEEVEEYVEPINVNRRRGLKSNMQLFKLADENQLGGLSHLIGGGPSSMVKKNDNNNNNMAGQEVASDDDLIIDESGAVVVGGGEEPFANMRTHAARMEVTPKRKLLDHHSEFQAMKRAKRRADYLESAGNVVQNDSPQKSSRACKGKKYLEFIKQTKAVASSSSSVLVSESSVGPIGNGQQSVIARTPVQQQQQVIVMQQVGFPHNGYCKPHRVIEVEQQQEMVVEERERRKMDVVVSPAKQKTRDISHEGQQQQQRQETHNGNETDRRKREKEVETTVEVAVVDGLEGDEKLEQNNGKLFDASDFELDSKIIALPALSLDTYLMRKRETKKKKKIGGKGKSHAKKQATSGGPTIHEVKEAMQKSAVGSQKRKARKESITRRDVNSITGGGAVNSVQEEEHVGGGEASGSASDLLILATLAAGEIETHQQ